MSTATPTATSSSDTTAQTALSVGGMDCASCVAHVEKAARKVDGVEVCSVNLARGRAVVRFDSGKTNPTQIAAAISDAGYPAEPEDQPALAPGGVGIAAGESGMNPEERRLAR